MPRCSLVLCLGGGRSSSFEPFFNKSRRREATREIQDGFESCFSNRRKSSGRVRRVAAGAGAGDAADAAAGESDENDRPAMPAIQISTSWAEGDSRRC